MMMLKKAIDGKMYKVVDGTYYHKDTPDKVINILEIAQKNKTRLIFYFGDRKTGKDWKEIHDIVGYVGRSANHTQDISAFKIPLLIYNSRSSGGRSLLTNAIVKIETAKGKRVLYEHPKYHK